MHDLKAEYLKRRPDGHWFDAGTLKWFQSRIGEIRRVGHIFFFISSEKPPWGPRKYTVRRMEITGQINNVTEFCESSRSQARTALKYAIDEETKK